MMNCHLSRIACLRGAVGFCVLDRVKLLGTTFLLQNREIQVTKTRQQRSFHVTGSQCKKKLFAKPINLKMKSKEQSEIIEISRTLTVAELSEAMNKDIGDVIKTLGANFKIGGRRATFSRDSVLEERIIDAFIRMHGLKFKYKAKHKDGAESEAKNKDVVRQPPPDPSVLVKRPPVVTIMGHVDHGKTTLLDAIRHSSIVNQEFGGITQHIGAFVVTLPSGENITFLDTPGHAAFSAMRARGARVTDVIVLVVAADDSVMQQTIESIEHAKRENVPVVVAINKVDKHGCDIERVKRELMMHGIIVEDLSGDVQALPVSALKGDNLLALQEAIVIQSELMDLTGDPVGKVEGSVIESRKDIGRGKLATVIIQRGTLKKGDVLVAGNSWAKVRGMFNDDGKPIQTATLSKPVQIIGWRELPSAGDDILQVDTEQEAKAVLKWRLDQEKLKQAEEDSVAINKKREEHNQEYNKKRDEMFARGHRRMRSQFRGPKKKEADISYEGPELCIILKGDVDGSVDAILDVLDTYQSDQCRLTLLHYGVGDITESDVDLVQMFNGVIFGFNVKAPSDVLRKCQTQKVDLRMHNVIYKMFDEIAALLTARLLPLKQEAITGEASILQTFSFKEKNHTITIAGCKCVKGIINKEHKIQLIRDEELIYEGSIKSLKHLKTEVKTIKKDVECGICLDDPAVEFRPGDTIVCYQMADVPQTLNWKLGF